MNRFNKKQNKTYIMPEFAKGGRLWKERRVELKILENFPKFIHVTDVYIHKIKEFIFFSFPIF